MPIGLIAILMIYSASKINQKFHVFAIQKMKNILLVVTKMELLRFGILKKH